MQAQLVSISVYNETVLNCLLLLLLQCVIYLILSEVAVVCVVAIFMILTRSYAVMLF